jgi:Na+-transporting methylmalonyl-CoA/oxaloacetate decarboxylase gamma subunit
MLILVIVGSKEGSHKPKEDAKINNEKEHKLVAIIYAIIM